MRKCIMARKILISIVFLQIPVLLYSFYFLLQEFRQICPNQEFLSWDADLRFIKTLQLMDHFRHFEIFSFLFQLLDSPTWPVFRNLIQILVFLFTGVSTYADVMINVVTFAVLLGLVLHVLYYLSNGNWISGLLFFPVWVMLFLSPPILVYTFSAMLEIQGALFFLASIYYLFFFYKEPNSYTDKMLLLKLSLSVFALFNTKYPYGYLFLLALLLVHASLYIDEAVLFVTRYIAYITNVFQKQYRIIAILLLALIYLLIPEFILKGKSKTYLKYMIVILASVDFYIYLFKQTDELMNLKFQKLVTLLKWVFLPVVIYVLIHPDRFSSSSGTLAHVQTEGYMVGEAVEKNLDYYFVFFRAITSQSFSSEWIGYLLLAGLFISVGFGYYNYYKLNKLENYFFFSLISLTSILILTFLTPNHQARHIYHLLPTIAVGVILFAASFEEKHKKLLYGFLFLLSIGVLIPFVSKLSNQFSGETVCYTGKNKDDFFTPREIEKLFKDRKENTIFFNFINPIHINKADTELVLTKIGYENKIKILMNPKNFKRNPREDGFNEVYILADSCEKEYLVETWFKQLHPYIKLVKQDDPKLSVLYEVTSEGKPFLLGPPYPAKNLLDRKIYKDPRFSTGEGCLQTIRFTILP